MTECHEANHAIWMQRLLDGELTSDAAEVAALRGCPQCAVPTADRLRLLGDLAAAGVEQQDVLREAAAMAPLREEAEIASMLAVLRRPPRRRWRWVAAVAAVVLVGLAVVLIVSRENDDTVDPDQMLNGGGAAAGLAPVGQVASLEEALPFRWPALDQAPGMAVRVLVFEREASVVPLLRSEPLTGMTWAPADLAPLRALGGLHWRLVEVDQRGLDGRVLRQASVRW
ncbi:MAG: hypothetical protein AAF628_31735 [Planctomycetota bacterium]